MIRILDNIRCRYYKVSGWLRLACG